MAYIKSRKHAVARAIPSTSTLVAAAAAAVAFASPVAAQTSTTLKEVRVEDSAASDYKADTSANTKFTAPLIDVPQTVQVIKEQIIREQGATTLTEALRNTPGVGTFFLGENGTTNTGDAIQMRGFDSSSSIFVDGVRDLGSISRDVFNIEQLEVVKGPAGTDVGRTSPTGYINMITKKPRLDDSFTGSIGAGSADYKRTSIDWNKALSTANGSGTAMRLNAVVEDTGVAGRDYIKNKRWAIAPSFAFGLNTPTTIYLDYLHVDQKNVPDGGVPTIGLPGYQTPDPARPFLSTAARVNPSNFYGTTSDYDNVTADMFTVRLEHKVTPTTTVRNVTRFGVTKEDYMLTSFLGSSANLVAPAGSSPSTWTIARSSPTNKNQTNKIFTNQTSVSSEFATGSVKHTMNAGIELIREEQDNLGYFAPGAFNNGVSAGVGAWPAANLYNPDPNVSGYIRVRNGADTHGRTDTLGAYIFDTAKLTEQWQLTGGLRVDRYSTHTDAGARSANPAGVLSYSSFASSDTLVTGKLGIVYKPSENGSIYAAMGSAAQPPGGANFALSAAANSAANANYEPQKAKTYEIGTKWDLLNKKLSLNSAIFRTDVTNEVVQDPVSLLYYQTGKKRVQGVELSAAGAITDRLGISAGYTVMDTKVLSGPVVLSDGSTALAYTPRNSFTSWLTYGFPGGVTIGAGARYTGQLLRGTDSAVGTPKYVESYWVADAMATYKVNKNVDIQLNIYNLFDKDYVAAINKSGYRYTPGAPRSFKIAANFTF